MKQLELFEDGLVPIQRWLHVWTDAERAALNKKTPSAPALETPGRKLPKQGEEAGVMRPSACAAALPHETDPGGYSGNISSKASGFRCAASPRQKRS